MEEDEENGEKKNTISRKTIEVITGSSQAQVIFIEPFVIFLINFCN
jgi:hypothetical protein